MTDSKTATRTPAPTRTLEVQVERTNRSGFCSEGIWYDYGRTFKGEPLGQDAVGSKVKVTLVQSSKNDKWYIRSIDEIQAASGEEAPDASAEVHSDDAAAPEAEIPRQEAEEAPAGEEPARGNAPASEKQTKFAKDLAAKREIPDEDLDRLSLIRFQKDFSALTRSEMSLVIPFLGGYQNSRRQR